MKLSSRSRRSTYNDALSKRLRMYQVQPGNSSLAWSRRTRPRAVNSRLLTRGRLEAVLQKVYDGILALIDQNLIPSESAGKPKAFYFKMKSNFYRYLAEFATGDTKSKAAEDARVVHAEATKVQNTVEVPRVQYIDKTVDVPVVTQG